MTEEEKIKSLTNKTTFWADCRDICKGIVLDWKIKRLQYIAEKRFDELEKEELCQKQKNL